MATLNVHLMQAPVSTPRFDLAAWLVARINSRSAWLDKRRRYRKTVDELSRLSDRALADLGIFRADIPAVARAAAGDA